MNTATGPALTTGATLSAGRSISTANGQMNLLMQSNGDLVLSAQSAMIWHSDTAGNPGAYAIQQSDGNLVLYVGSTAIFSTKTQGHPGATARLDTDGRLSVAVGSRVLWSSGTTDSTLSANQTLMPGWALSSANDSFRLVMQTDGNLVFYSGPTAQWSSHTSGHNAARAVQQSDGNLVIYSGARPIWSSFTSSYSGAVTSLGNDGTVWISQSGAVVRNLVGSNTLAPGQQLRPGWSINAPNGQYRLIMQGDGNLVIYSVRKAVWSTQTFGRVGAAVVMQTDGNLVMYQGVRAVWHTGTSGYHDAVARLDDDGQLVVFSAVQAPVWWRDRGLGDEVCNGVASDPNGTEITRWNPVSLCVLTVLDQPISELADVNTIIEYESGGNPNAINLYDINYQEGHPSKGLIQVIQPTFNRFRSLQLSSDLFNPAANLYAGLNYAIYTYGSIHNVPGLVSLRNGGPYKGYIAKPGG